MKGRPALPPPISANIKVNDEGISYQRKIDTIVGSQDLSKGMPGMPKKFSKGVFRESPIKRREVPTTESLKKKSVQSSTPAEALEVGNFTLPELQGP
jgi:hypothetical protein